MSEEVIVHPESLISAIRGDLALHPDAVGWVIESDFRSAYENCAVTVKSVESSGPHFPHLSNARLWKIGGLPIHAETEDDSQTQTWGALVGSGGGVLITIRTDRPKYFVSAGGE